VTPRQPRHVLALLRQKLRLTQGELGRLIGAAQITVQTVERGKLPLSDFFATRISEETGVSKAWLLKNDLNAPPLNRYGRDRWTMDDYARAQAGMFRGEFLFEYAMRMKLLRSYILLRGISEEFHPMERMTGVFQRIYSETLWECLETLPDERAQKEVFERYKILTSKSDADTLRFVQADVQELLRVLKEHTRLSAQKDKKMWFRKDKNKQRTSFFASGTPLPWNDVSQR
jgi:transcriptional regulator with XRE-family HTH domain